MEQKLQQGKQDRVSSDKSNIWEIMISGHTVVMEVSDTITFTVCIHTHTHKTPRGTEENHITVASL
jgi:hypothetical protein